jgi:hypothetical protein
MTEHPSTIIEPHPSIVDEHNEPNIRLELERTLACQPLKIANLQPQ